jgi:hypothetical protein
MNRRWCTTTLGGPRHDHQTLAEANQRADDLAARVATGAVAEDRMTIWSNADDGRGWQSHTVVDLRFLAGAA